MECIDVNFATILGVPEFAFLAFGNDAVVINLNGDVKFGEGDFVIRRHNKFGVGTALFRNWPTFRFFCWKASCRPISKKRRSDP